MPSLLYSIYKASANTVAVVMLIVFAGGVLLTSVAPFINLQFLGPSLTFMLVYVWARRHQAVTMSFMGMFNFTAPYLPWVLLAFSVVLGSSPVVDLLGMAAGHIYYFFEDVYPRVTGGRRFLKTPGIIKALFAAESMAAIQPPIVLRVADDAVNAEELPPQGLHDD